MNISKKILNAVLKKGNQIQDQIRILNKISFFCFRDDLKYDEARGKWISEHAQLASRNPCVQEYRQYHFEKDSFGLWPTIPGVETSIPINTSFNGMSEMKIKSFISGLMPNAKIMSKRIENNESKIFCRSVLHFVSQNNSILDIKNKSENIGFRMAVLVAKRKNINFCEFAYFIKNHFAFILDSSPDVLEININFFSKNKKYIVGIEKNDCKLKNAYEFDASIIIGVKSKENLLNVLNEISTLEFNKEISKNCNKIHAYSITNTYLFCQEGRSTLPQVRPGKKTSLNPVVRKVNLAPERSKRMFGSEIFPPSKIISISGAGPEDVVEDNQGRIIYGTVDGQIFRFDPQTSSEDLLCNTGGRPLGLEVTFDDNLLICDAHKGLLQFNIQNNKLDKLVEYIEGVPLRFCSNACMARDGTIWFTQSTTRFDLEQYKGAFLEHRPSGRLLMRSPNGHIKVVLDNLYFPNGLILNENESALLFVETAAYCLKRYWLKGKNKGLSEVLVDNMPGFPDNLSHLKNGRFWVAMAGNRNIFLDKLAERPPFLRKLIWKIPDSLQPNPAASVWAICYDENGKQIFDLQTNDLNFSQTTGVVESSGKLYFATVEVGRKAILEVDISKLV